MTFHYGTSLSSYRKSLIPSSELNYKRKTENSKCDISLDLELNNYFSTCFVLLLHVDLRLFLDVFDPILFIIILTTGFLASCLYTFTIMYCHIVYD